MLGQCLNCCLSEMYLTSKELCKSTPLKIHVYLSLEQHITKKDLRDTKHCLWKRIQKKGDAQERGKKTPPLKRHSSQAYYLLWLQDKDLTKTAQDKKQQQFHTNLSEYFWMDRTSDTAWQQLLNYVLLLLHTRLGSSRERMSGTVLKKFTNTSRCTGQVTIWRAPKNTSFCM